MDKKGHIMETPPFFLLGMAVPVKRLYHKYKTKRRGRKLIKSCDVNIIAAALGVEVNELYRKEG